CIKWCECEHPILISVFAWYFENHSIPASFKGNGYRISRPIEFLIFPCNFLIVFISPTFGYLWLPSWIDPFWCRQLLAIDPKGTTVGVPLSCFWNSVISSIGPIRSFKTDPSQHLAISFTIDIGLCVVDLAWFGSFKITA